MSEKNDFITICIIFIFHNISSCYLKDIKVKLKLNNCQLLLDLYTYYKYVVYQLMYENVYGKTPPPRSGENAVTLPLDVDRPCFIFIYIYNIGQK